MPVECSTYDSCVNAVSVDINLFCAADDLKQLGNAKTENDYALDSFFSSTLNGRYVISFVTLDNSAVYENFNSKSIQNLNLNIYFRVVNGTCTIVD